MSSLEPSDLEPSTFWRPFGSYPVHLRRGRRMNVLLLSMPDSFEHTPSLTMRMPNGALASLAGNVDPHHDVAVADLVLAQQDVPGTVRRLVAEHAPDVVGLSVMTFQRRTARKVIALVRALQPGVHVVVRRLRPEPRAGGLRGPRRPAWT